MIRYMHVSCAVVFCGALLVNSGCSSDPHLGRGVYSNTELRSANAITRCLVVEAGSVQIAESSTDKEKLSGVVVGGIAGVSLADAVSDDPDFLTAGAIAGAILGANIVENVSSKNRSRIGVRYVVALKDGSEISVVQDVQPGEAFLSKGDSCIVETSANDGNLSRVLPAAQKQIGPLYY